MNPEWSLPPQLLSGGLGNIMQKCWRFQTVGTKFAQKNQEKWKSQCIISSHLLTIWTSPSTSRSHLKEIISITFSTDIPHHPGASCVSCGQLSNTPPWMWLFHLNLDDLELHPFLKCYYINFASGSIFWGCFDSSSFYHNPDTDGLPSSLFISLMSARTDVHVQLCWFLPLVYLGSS